MNEIVIEKAGTRKYSDNTELKLMKWNHIKNVQYSKQLISSVLSKCAFVFREKYVVVQLPVPNAFQTGLEGRTSCLSQCDI